MSVLDPCVGEELTPLDVDVTRAMLVRYAGASGDFNPIHYSDAAAADLGLPSVIAHGMLTMGLALRVVTDWCGDPGRVASYSVRFTKPVPVPDGTEGVRVQFAGRVTEVSDGLATVTVDAVADEVKVLGSVAAVVRCG